MLLKKNEKGFTLIELLVVVSIIGVLASIILSSLNDARARARDARRLSDMRSIRDALVLYELDNGFIPITTSYGGNDVGGWDNSVDEDFLDFLVEDGYMSSVPVDPINNATESEMSSNSLNSSAFGYRYYCYFSGSSAGLSLGYRRESDSQFINYSTIAPLGDAQGTGDNYFICGNHN